MKKTAAPHRNFNRVYASGKWHRSPCDPSTYFLATWNTEQQRMRRVASILLCFLHITSTNTAVALVVNQEVIVYLPEEAASHPQHSTWCLDPNSLPHHTHQQKWQHEWREFSDSLYLRFFLFPPVPPHVPYGLRGLPSRLWPKCNWRLWLESPRGAVMLSRWGGWWYMNMKYQECP
jgi:hypothetical protein